eukprot:gene33166-biopygen21453
MRAIFITLVKDLLFLFSLCLDLKLDIHLLVAIIMEDNFAVIITITTDDQQAYLKKCKHFLMVINYIREQVELSMIDIRKIAGEGAFEQHSPKILGEKRPATSLIQ